jgi:hypothetical protein
MRAVAVTVVTLRTVGGSLVHGVVKMSSGALPGY